MKMRTLRKNKDAESFFAQLCDVHFPFSKAQEKPTATKKTVYRVNSNATRYNRQNYSASLCVYAAGCRFPFSHRPLDNETQRN